PASGLTGHESANARYLVSLGAASMAESDDDAVHQAARLLNDSAARAPLQAAALRAARPLAAEVSAEFVLRRARCVKNETNYALRNAQYAIQG
ncbi:MAG TPA: hypothetical protein VII92_02945, partial [Anaerolineae bacterium]